MVEFSCMAPVKAMFAAFAERGVEVSVTQIC
jgi:hypothetical protein